jgi:hypothetical protein
MATSNSFLIPRDAPFLKEMRPNLPLKTPEEIKEWQILHGFIASLPDTPVDDGSPVPKEAIFTRFLKAYSNESNNSLVADLDPADAKFRFQVMKTYQEEVAAENEGREVPIRSTLTAAQLERLEGMKRIRDDLVKFRRWANDLTQQGKKHHMKKVEAVLRVLNLYGHGAPWWVKYLIGNIAAGLIAGRTATAWLSKADTYFMRELLLAIRFLTQCFTWLVNPVGSLEAGFAFLMDKGLFSIPSVSVTIAGIADENFNNNVGLFVGVGAALTAFVYGLTVFGFYWGVYSDWKVPRNTRLAAKKEEITSLTADQEAKMKVQIGLYNARVNEHIELLASFHRSQGARAQDNIYISTLYEVSLDMAKQRGIDVTKASAEDLGAYFLAAASAGILGVFFWCSYGPEAKNFFVGTSVLGAHAIRRFSEILIHFYEGTQQAKDLFGTIIAPVLIQLGGIAAPYKGMKDLQHKSYPQSDLTKWLVLGGMIYVNSMHGSALPTWLLRALGLKEVQAQLPKDAHVDYLRGRLANVELDESMDDDIYMAWAKPQLELLNDARKLVGKGEGLAAHAEIGKALDRFIVDIETEPAKNVAFKQRLLTWRSTTDKSVHEAVQSLVKLVELGTNPDDADAVSKWRTLFDNRNAARKKNAALLYVLGFSEDTDPDTLVEMDLLATPIGLPDRYHGQTAAICGAGPEGMTTAMRVAAFGGQVRIYSDPEHTTTYNLLKGRGNTVAVKNLVEGEFPVVFCDKFDDVMNGATLSFITTPLSGVSQMLARHQRYFSSKMKAPGASPALMAMFFVPGTMMSVKAYRMLKDNVAYFVETGSASITSKLDARLAAINVKKMKQSNAYSVLGYPEGERVPGELRKVVRSTLINPILKRLVTEELFIMSLGSMVHPIPFGVKDVFEAMKILHKDPGARFYKDCFGHPASIALAKRYSEYLKKVVRLVLGKETEGLEVLIAATYPLNTPAPPGEEISAWAISDGPHNMTSLIPDCDPEALVHHRFYSEDMKNVVRIKWVAKLHGMAEEDMAPATQLIAAWDDILKDVLPGGVEDQLLDLEDWGLDDIKTLEDWKRLFEEIGADRRRSFSRSTHTPSLDPFAEVSDLEVDEEEEAERLANQQDQLKRAKEARMSMIN